MSRLTEKFNHDGFKYMATGLGFNYPYAIDKLGKLEDLEEELGCPLDVVIRALNDGIYANRRKYESVEPIEVFDHFYVTFDGSVLYNESEYPYNYDELFKVSPVSNEFYISDYKKTWWLKEDMSE